MSSTIIESTSEREHEESYYYKWTNHQNHLSDVVRQLLEEECMVDVTLVADGERIQAHRIVLCSCSTLFQEIFSQTSDEHATIILSDISAQDIRSIVEFSYHGEVKIPVENISNLLEAAHSLRICGLMEIDGLDENDASISVKDSKGEIEFFEDLDESADSTENTADPLSIDDGGNKSDEGEDKSTTCKGKVRRKYGLKRGYNKDMLSTAINDLKSGRSLLEASVKNNVPRSTLYMKAKALGVQMNVSRNEYSAECVKAAIDAVMDGASLQHASDRFFIPKTVLWRRIQKEGYQLVSAESKRTYGKESKEAAVKALERGENLSRVAQQFQIPKTTLFREKIRLVDEGKLPESVWKKRNSENEQWKRLRLAEAVAVCKEGRMSQAAASIKYQIPKTTIWRRLQQAGKSRETKKNERSCDNEKQSSVKNEQENTDFALCEVSTELPITYIDQNLGADSVLILTTEDVDGLNLDESREIIVNRDSGQEYVRCALNISENTGSSDYQPAES